MTIRKRPFQCRRDGLTIRGHVFRAAGDSPLPAAIVSHEFMENSRSVEKYARTLAEEGYIAFTYDFCGGCIIGRSDGRTQDMTVLTEMRDLRAVMDAVRAHPETAPGKLLLMGCSQGGLVSAMTAAQYPNEVERLVLFYPALSIPDDARRGRMITFRFDPENIPEILGRIPIALGRNYAATAQTLDPFSMIAGYPGPVLLIHGTADHLVPLSYSQKAAAVYGEGCRLVELPGADHIYHGTHAERAKCLLREFVRGREEILTVDVKLTRIRPAQQALKTTLTIPFTGTADSKWFHGEIQPGAEDRQVWLGAKRLHALADYTLRGTDCAGKPCTIHIQNEDDGSGWKPRVSTDSEALSFLNDADCSALVIQRGLKGPLVHIFAAAPKKEKRSEHLRIEALKQAVRASREKQIRDIRKRCPTQGEERLLPRDGKKSIRTYFYKPQNALERAPILVNIHGGAWVGGDALMLDTQSKLLSERLGCFVYNLNYVKADVEPMPYCQEEARDAIEYLIDHASDFGGDASRIAVIGYSAGAQIAASAAQMVFDDGYRLSCQILCYPMVDFTYDGGRQTDLTARLREMEDAGKVFFERISRTNPKVSPALRSDFKGLAPAIIVACGRDSLNVQAEQYHRLLTAAGVSSELLFYPEAIHGFLEVNYPESLPQEAKSPEQEALMHRCEEDIATRLHAVWNQKTKSGDDEK